MEATGHAGSADEGEHEWGESDDAAEIRYSLTVLGEALVREPYRAWRGFGPCSTARAQRPAERRSATLTRARPT